MMNRRMCKIAALFTAGMMLLCAAGCVSVVNDSSAASQTGSSKAESSVQESSKQESSKQESSKQESSKPESSLPESSAPESHEESSKPDNTSGTESQGYRPNRNPNLGNVIDCERTEEVKETFGDLEVTTSLFVEEGWGNVMVFMSVTSNAEEDLGLRVIGTLKSEDGTALSEDYYNFSVIAAHTTALIAFNYMNIKEKNPVFQYSVDVSDEYKTEKVDVGSLLDLTVDENKDDSMLIVRVHNPLKTAVFYPLAYVLFMDEEDHVLNATSVPLGDVNNELVPDAFATGTALYFGMEPYDHYHVYVLGDKMEDEGTKLTQASLDDVEIHAGFYENEWGSNYVMVMTNHAEVPLHAEVNAVFYDDQDRMVDVSNAGIDVLAPGQASVMTFYSYHDFSYVVYTYSISDQPSFLSAYKDLNIEVTQTGTAVNVTVENTGKLPCSSALVYIFCYDAEGKLIQISSDLFMDGIPAGATDSLSMEIMENAADIECYMNCYTYAGN